MHTLSLAPRALLLAGAVLVAAPLAAQSAPPKTAAGTVIENTATASYDDPNGGAPTTVTSGTVRLTVDELIDVLVSPDGGPTQTRNGAKRQVTRFIVANTGNGSESFRLAATGTVTGDDFDLSNVQIYLDGAGGTPGQFDPSDTLYTPGAGDPALPQDGTAVVFVLADVPATAADGQSGLVRLTATSTTGTGPAGTVIPGGGVGGGDAVIGTSTGTRFADARYLVAATAVTLRKEQSVLDPFGTTRTVPGSVITYTLTAEVTGSGQLNGFSIRDVVPAGTVFEAGSITLGGAAKTDAADGDEGQFTGNTVTVAPGAITAPATRTVTFRVKVQ